MNKIIVKIDEQKYLFENDVSVIIGTSHVKILEFSEDGHCKETELLKEPTTPVVVSNWNA